MDSGTKVQIWQIFSPFLQRTETKVSEPVSLLLIFESLEEECFGADKDDERGSGPMTPHFPPEWRMLSSLEMGICFMREDELFKCNLCNKAKACVFWHSVPRAVHSIGAAKRDSMTSWEWWSVLNGGLWRTQWRGALARPDRIISALAWLPVLIHSFLFRMIQGWESKCREPKRRDLESHSTFWKLGKIMDCLDPWNQEKIGIHINADFAYNFGVYRPTEASLHTLS